MNPFLASYLSMTSQTGLLPGIPANPDSWHHRSQIDQYQSHRSQIDLDQNTRTPSAADTFTSTPSPPVGSLSYRELLHNRHEEMFDSQHLDENHSSDGN